MSGATEEPWSSYRVLNAGMERLASILDECDEDFQVKEARALCLDLVQQAKTVETAAMARALQYVDDTVMKEAAVRAGNDENVVHTISQARQELRFLLDQVKKG